MSGFAAAQDTEPLARGWDWAAVDSVKGTVVDVGGGWGPVCISLAKHYPNIKFVVQDFADVVAEGPEHVPAELKGRISFMDYNFLEQEQPVRDASVFYLRAILHNWPDPYCVKILRNLLPGKSSASYGASIAVLIPIIALKKGGHILVQDWVLGEPWSLPAYTEKYYR